MTSPTGEVKQVSSSSLTRMFGDCLNGLGSSVVPRHQTCISGYNSEKRSGPNAVHGYRPTLCSASTFLMHPQECFSLHDSWMSKKSLSALQEDKWFFVFIPSWASFSVPKGKSSFDDVSSAWFAKQVLANFWCVAGNAVLTSQQPTLQSDVRLWLQAIGFLREHLLWQVSPGAARTTSYCLIKHIWIHCTPSVSKLGHPHRRNCFWSAVRAIRSLLVKSYKAVKTLRQMPELLFLLTDDFPSVG